MSEPSGASGGHAVNVGQELASRLKALNDRLIYGNRLERITSLEAEVARLRLTDEERKAISRIYDLLSERSRELQAARRIEESTPYVQLAKTLQTMWERLK